MSVSCGIPVISVQTELKENISRSQERDVRSLLAVAKYALQATRPPVWLLKRKKPHGARLHILAEDWRLKN
jgi:hypothetical protein